MVVEELRLVGSDVYTRRTIGHAAFAGKAEVESVAHCHRPPAATDRVSSQHLLEKARLALVSSHAHFRLPGSSGT